MGMYTNLYLNVELVLDDIDALILKRMCDKDAAFEISDNKLPNHPFFACGHNVNYRYFFWCKNSYLDGMVPMLIKDDAYANIYRLKIDLSLKNYENEINNFLDWIKDYVRKGSRSIGYIWYEEDMLQTFVTFDYAHDNKVVVSNEPLPFDEEYY